MTTTQLTNEQKYKITFENGETVISYGLSYIQVIAWEKMYNSKISKSEFYY